MLVGDVEGDQSLLLPLGLNNQVDLAFTMFSMTQYHLSISCLLPTLFLAEFLLTAHAFYFS